jgi:hypothetical protein
VSRLIEWPLLLSGLLLKKRAEHLLSATWGTVVCLQSTKHHPREAHVRRFLVQVGPQNLMQSVIVKQMRTFQTNNATSASYPAAAWRFFNDWAGLQFVSQAVQTAAISPHFYAGDRAKGFFIIEDLHPATPLGTLLAGQDAPAASSALLHLARVLGNLHARTRGKEALFNALRTQLAPQEASWGWVPPWQRAPATYRRLLATLEESVRRQGFTSYRWMPVVLRQVTSALSIPVSTQAEAELEQVVQALSMPGPFWAYTHGDPCPDNCLLQQQTLKLIDFENGTFRHALLDAVYGRMLFPTCWQVYQLPNHLIQQMEAAYRAELIPGCPEAADETRFAQELVHACAYWVLLLCQFNTLSLLLRHDQRWGTATMRQRVLARFAQFAQTTEEFGYLEALGHVFAALANHLQDRWQAESIQLPLYPAFRSP